MKIRIKDLRLRTIIGIEDWEREKKQDVTVNIVLEFDGGQAAHTDEIDNTVNYKKLTKQIIELVEDTRYQLLEKLANEILQTCLNTPRVQHAEVEVDKPHALRFADSVSITASGKSEDKSG